MSKPGLVNRATTTCSSISWSGQPGNGNINSQKLNFVFILNRKMLFVLLGKVLLKCKFC